MLYELFIEGQKADLTENIEICLSYTDIDTSKPEAVHGAYSKSVELPATATNNNIFGQLYDLSRSILNDGGESAVGAYFDPRKRTNYTLWYNGDIVEKGYLKIDNVIKENGDIKYSCTLFSDLGDFFYSLMYSQTGEELTLADLHYGFVDEDDNYIDEDNGTLLYWDKDYIYESWARLNYELEPTDRSLYSCITAAPSYSGFYDDFDCSKVLFNYDSVEWPTGTTVNELLAPVVTSDLWTRSGYTDYKGWILTEATRDLEEWETRDLRSVNQRPCIKMSVVLDAISDPANNGGFEVEWDDEIKNSPYYQKTYLVMNRLDFDLDERVNTFRHIDMSTPTGATWVHTFTSIPIYDEDGGQTATTFDLSSFNNPRVAVSTKSILDFGVFSDQVGQGQTLYTSYHPHLVSNMGYTHAFDPYYFGGQAVRLTAYKDGVAVKHSPTLLVTTPCYRAEDKPFGYSVYDWRQQIASQLGIDGDDIVPSENALNWNENQYSWVNPFTVELSLPQDTGISITLDTCWVWAANTNVLAGSIAVPNGENVWMYGLTSYQPVMVDNDDVNSGLYDGTINPNIQKTNVTKKVLFGETESPYSYLVGFTRMLGAKYRYDLASKKIYIQTRAHYYLPEGYNIDNYIDRKDTIEIQPTLSEYKWYRYALETPETYVSQMYKKKNKYEYGEAKIDTGYYFNADTHDVFEDIPYTNAVPYLQSSLYYAVYSGVPAIMNSPTLDVSVFKRSGDEMKDESIKIKGYGSFYTIPVLKDSTGDKICCFDEDNSIVDDIKNCLLFYNGKRDTVDWYQISDNLPIMQDMNEAPCYMFIRYGYSAYPEKDAAEKVRVCQWVNKIPVFSKYLTNDNGVYTDSMDFIKPNYTFIGDEANYQDGICLYDRYWKEYINDLYDPDNKAVTVKMFLKEQPDRAMRKFYFFDNSVWVISEITDYSASSDAPTEVKFVKVYNTNNYITEPVEWNAGGIYK